MNTTGLPIDRDASPGIVASVTASLITGINRTRLIFLGLQGLHIICLWVLADEGRPTLLAISGLLCICVYSYLLKAELVSAGTVVSPFILYLCAAILVVGLSPLWAASVYANGLYEVFSFGRYDTSGHLVEGHSLLLTGDWFLIAGYSFVARRGAPSPVIGSSEAGRVVIAGLAVLAAGWFLEIATRLGLDPSGLGNWYKTFAKFSGPAGLLMLIFARSRLAGTDRRILLGVILVCFGVELLASLYSNMKQEAMQVLLPVVIYLFSQVLKPGAGGRNRLNIPAVLIGGAISVFVILILFPFNEMRRVYAWEGRTRVELPDPMPFLREALRASVPGTAAFAELHQFPDTGLWSFLDRHAYLRGSAWSYGYVAQSGNVRGEFFRDGVLALVPRVIWPNKPMISAGRKVAVMCGQAKEVETATTSSDAGSMAGALYLNWGFPSLVLGMFANGAVLCLIWRIIAGDMLVNPFAAITAMLLYVGAGRYFASAADGNIAFYVTIFVLYLPLTHLTKRLFRGREDAGPVTARMAA